MKKRKRTAEKKVGDVFTFEKHKYKIVKAPTQGRCFSCSFFEGYVSYHPEMNCLKAKGQGLIPPCTDVVFVAVRKKKGKK